MLGTVLFPPPNKGITLVQTPINAPDHDGYALLSTRWQIVGSESCSVVNFVSLWDDFVLWKINKRGTTGLTEICIHVHFSIGLYETSFTRELAYDRYRFVVQAKHLPPRWGVKEPSLGGQQVTMFLEKESDTTVTVKWIGHLCAFAGHPPASKPFSHVSSAELSLVTQRRIGR